MLECGSHPVDATTRGTDAGVAREGDAIAAAMRVNGLGDKCYYDGDLPGAATHFDEAWTILGDAPASGMATRARAVVSRNRAVLALIGGDWTTYQQQLDACRDLTSRVDGPEREELQIVLQVAASLGHRTAGRFGEARDALRLDWPPCPPATSCVRDLRFSIEEANICRNLGQFRAAVALLERGFELLELARTDPSAPGDETLEGCTILLHHYMGVTRIEDMLFRGTRDAGAFTASRVHLHAARDMATHFMGDAFRIYVSRTDKALGWYHLLRGDAARARELAETVLRAPGTQHDRRTECLVLTLRAAAVASTSPADGLELFEEPYDASTRYGYWKGKLLACFVASSCAREAGDHGAMKRWMDRLAGLGRLETRLLVEEALYTAASPAAGARAVATSERSRFVAQASAWRDAVREGRLDAEAAVRHPIFLHLLAIGVRAVPWILHEWLEHPEDPWGIALPVLTGTAPADAPDVATQREWWLTWGRTQGTMPSR